MCVLGSLVPGIGPILHPRLRRSFHAEGLHPLRATTRFGTGVPKSTVSDPACA
jgi:hypothetical protein